MCREYFGNVTIKILAETQATFMTLQAIKFDFKVVVMSQRMPSMMRTMIHNEVFMKTILGRSPLQLLLWSKADLDGWS